MVADIIVYIVLGILSTAISVIIPFFIKQIKINIELKNTYMKHFKGSIIVMLKSNLLYLYDISRRSHYRTIMITKTFLSIYEEYKALGGNSFIDDLKNKFLEIRLSNNDI